MHYPGVGRSLGRPWGWATGLEVMSANPRDSPGKAADAMLSVEAASFYAAIYSSARNGSIAELRRRGCGTEEAEEFFSAAFENVIATVDPIERHFSEPEMVKFIKQAAWRQMIDDRRARGQRIDLEVESIQLSDPTAEGPAEAAEEREAIAMGREALQMLSERDRRIFRQRHQMDLSPEEIVRRTPGLTRRTYRKIIQRANTRVLAAFERIEAGQRCEEMESRLLGRYVAEECDESEQLAVEVHLAHCRACQLSQARLRGHLLDVAGGLVVATSAGADGRLGSLVGTPVRVVEGAMNGAQGLFEAGRAGRERLRDLMFRFAGGAPGAGGDATVGQALTATTAKVASVCAAGVAVGACVAAGVVPGIAGFGTSHRYHREGARRAHSAEAPKSRPVQPASTTAPPVSEATGTQETTETPKVKTKRHRSTEQAQTGSAGKEASSTSPETTSAPRELQEVSSGEFFDETGQPPSSSSPSSSSGSSGSGGGSSSGSGSRTSTKESSEFGL